MNTKGKFSKQAENTRLLLNNYIAIPPNLISWIFTFQTILSYLEWDANHVKPANLHILDVTHSSLAPEEGLQDCFSSAAGFYGADGRGLGEV